MAEAEAEAEIFRPMYFPAGQAVHDVAPAPEINPDAQDTQLPPPTALKPSVE